MNEGNTYQHFAMLYDALMAEAPYENWVDYLTSKLNQYHITAKKLLDIGCGTGTLALKLADMGFQVTGIDLSEEMLAMAANKAMEKGESITFIQQDIRELELGDTYPIATAFCDVVNYLPSLEDVEMAFRAVYDQLDSGGLFLFDVHSIYKIQEVFIGHSFSSADPDLSYIWESFEGDTEFSVEHELSFFVYEDSGLYRRYDELHQQRTFEIGDYKLALEKCGFTLLTVEGDFREGEPSENAERLFFIAQK